MEQAITWVKLRELINNKLAAAGIGDAVVGNIEVSDLQTMDDIVIDIMETQGTVVLEVN